jgi:N4-gp56 family major capsid protein
MSTNFNLKQFSLDNFIPAIWSAQLLISLKKSLVYGQDGVVNRDYEGEITQKGDTVKINSIGAVTIGNYTKNTDMTAPETLVDAQTFLQITQSKFFNFQIDDVDKAQQNPKVMQQGMQEAAYGLKNVADSFIAGLYTDVAADNMLGTDVSPKTISAVGGAYELLVDLSVKLDEANVPEQGRWIVVPPWYEGLMLKDDRFVKNGTTAGVTTLMNGQIGEAAGFNILKSNNVPVASSNYKVIAGYPGAISYAEQVNQVEAYRPEKRFADAVKGLHLYGGKLIRPSGIAVLTVTKPSL